MNLGNFQSSAKEDFAGKRSGKDLDSMSDQQALHRLQQIIIERELEVPLKLQESRICSGFFAHPHVPPSIAQEDVHQSATP